MLNARNGISTAVCPQSEIDFLKSMLEYHLDQIEEANRESTYHAKKAFAVMKEIEAYERN